jgi:hypothetical protein
MTWRSLLNRWVSPSLSVGGAIDADDADDDDEDDEDDEDDDDRRSR